MPPTPPRSKKTPGSLLILLLGLLVGFLIAYFVYNRPGLTGISDIGSEHDFDNQWPSALGWTGVPTTKADSNIDAYRKAMAMTNLSVFHAKGKPHCIVHNPGTALAYDTGFFRNFVATHTTADPKYIWALGYYPEICTDKMRDGSVGPRFSIFLIPTMRNKDTANYPRDILDYDSIKNTSGVMYYYPDSERAKIKQRLATTQTVTAPDGTIFNQGTIFP